MGFNRTGSCLFKQDPSDIDLVYPNYFTAEIVEKLNDMGFEQKECKIPWVPQHWRRFQLGELDVFEMNPVYYKEYCRAYVELCNKINQDKIWINEKSIRNIYINNRMIKFITNELDKRL